MNKYIKIAIAAALSAACACSCSKQVATEKEPELVNVDLTLGIEEAMDALTRTATPLFPEDENWLFDYYLVQFNAEGVSVRTLHRRTNVSVGDLVVTDQVALQVISGGMLTFVANIVPANGDYSDNPGWEQGTTLKIADNIDTYKTIKFDMAERVQRAEAGTLHHTPMCGYWKGDITSSAPVTLTATLGRMIVRMNVIIDNQSTSAVTKVELKNAAAKAYIFPQVVNDALADGDYINLPANNVNIPAGTTSTVYFYTAPNFCTGGGKKTELTFTAGGKTGSIDLGSDLNSGDYNLYMNTIYTFNITLK